MATVTPAAPPAWFRIVALVAVLWNAFGVFQYLSSVGLFGDPMTGMTAERAAAESIPPAIIGAFALGTFAGLIGSLGLLLRKRWALPALVLSLLALIVLEGWIVFLSGALDLFGGPGLPVTIVVVSALLAWLAWHARRRGWLG
ncbi:MAG TPA: hypothetical protein VF718_13555 [Allosphingosinicella sp.]|jgi:hypothetical protein